MDVFLAVLTVVIFLVMSCGLYMLRTRLLRHREEIRQHYLHRMLMTQREAVTRLDLEREGEMDERWKCHVCDFTNPMDQRVCVLCGTKQVSNRTESIPPMLEDTADVKRVPYGTSSSLSLSRGLRASVAAAPNVNTLNYRQRYARKRKEWTREIGLDGSAYWVRQDRVASVSLDPFQRPSTGFVTCLVRSSIQSEGRLTIAESSHADATRTIGGYKIRAEDMEVIDRISQLPFPQKYAWFLERMDTLLKPWDEGRIKVSVHRELILVESMEQLLGIQPEHIHYPMRIEFMNEVGIDAGGLQREWFTILFSKLLDDALGLFMTCHRNNQSVAINPNSRECTVDHLLYFRGIGRLIGRALLEGQTMHTRLCLPILKHFLGVPITFSDLQYVDPEVYKSMKYLKEHDGAEDLGITFSVVEVKEGKPRVLDLVENGQNVDVTDENKGEYLHLKLRYLMLDRYSDQLRALSQGLFEVVPQENLMVFDYQELELVLCGLQGIDVNDWQRNTTIGEGFGSSYVIDWFWEVLSDLTDDERARFLQYATGTARVPVQGFKGLTSYDGRICPFSIKPLLNQTRGLPRVHTCFNRVELPIYRTKNELKEAILTLLDMELTEFSEE